MTAVSILAGAIAGVLSAWGIGGGTLLVIYMTALGGLGQQSAAGINLLYFLPVSISALISHIKNKLILFEAVVPAVIAGVPASVAGSLLSSSIDTDVMKKIFGGFLILVGISEFFRKERAK